MIRLVLLLVATATLAVAARADRVELKDGSLVKGRITGVDAGKLRIETTFAGTLTLPLEQVRNFATEEAVYVRLGSGLPVLAHVAAADEGITLQSDAQRLTGAPVQVVALWRQGSESPTDRHVRELQERARRKWSYEASVAVSGRTGASEKFTGAFGAKATLAGDRDRLVLTGKVDRAEDKGVETANREFAGLDYSAFFTSDQGWYVRTSLDRDEIKSLDLRSTTATGFSRKLLRTAALDVEFRSGASYLYEDYATGKRFNSPGLDISLLNTWAIKAAKLTTAFTYVPTFRDWSNYRLHHESGLEVPLSASLWKLKLGLSNDYQSIPAAGVDRVDTTYFTSLLLNWK